MYSNYIESMNLPTLQMMLSTRVPCKERQSIRVCGPAYTRGVERKGQTRVLAELSYMISKVSHSTFVELRGREA